MRAMDSASPPNDDATIIAHVRSGDAGAFEILVRRYHPELFAFAVRRLGDSDAADDILQDVFLGVWRRRETLTAETPLRAYLYRAVRNALVNFRRDTARTARMFERVGDVGTTPHLARAEQGVASLDDPIAALEHAETIAAIEHAIAELPDRCREAWILVRERGLSYNEAAHVLGIAPGTVHAQVSRAFAAIRRAVGPFLAVAMMLAR